MADNTKSSLEAAMSYIQEKKLLNLVPNSAIIQKLIPLKKAGGRKYLQPVALTNELGLTFGDGTVFSYNDGIAAVYEEAEIDPSPVVLRSRISLSAVNKISNDPAQIQSLVAMRAGNMKQSMMKIAEITSLHGGSGIGTVSAVSDSSGTNVLTITDATWAPGVWAGMIGLKLDAYTSTTKQNSNAALVVSAVSFENKTVTVTGNSSDTAAIDVGSVLYLYGAYGVEQTGLIAQFDNAGSLFGINAATYDLWKACEETVSGALTFAKILAGQAKAVAKGGLDEDVVLLVSPKTFESLNDDISSLRSFDSDYKSSKGEMGVNSIVFHGQAGKIEIISHPFMKEGEACSFPKSSTRRIGSTDVDFIKGDDNGYFRALENAAGFQCVGQFEFQVLACEPAKCVLYKSIVNP